MPENRHHWTRRERGDDADFDGFVALIRERGWTGRWERRDYRYLDVDGHTYWWMPPGIVNRKNMEDVPGPGARNTQDRAPAADGNATQRGEESP
jgi:hypothetical protein